MIFCPKCAEAIQDNSSICPKCNAILNDGQENEQAVVYASQKHSGQQEPVQTQTRKPPKSIIMIVAAALLVVAVLFSVNEVQKSGLKKELLRDWIDTDGTILKVLDFSDSEIEYRLETGYRYLDTTVATYTYKIVSGNKIKIKRYGDDYETFVIEFNDEKSMFTVEPAITSIDSSEHWFNLD